MFLPHPCVKVSIVGSLGDREVACSASDRQGSNRVWRTVSSHHPQEVLLAQFSLYVHKGGLKPDSFHFASSYFTYHWGNDPHIINPLITMSILMKKWAFQEKVLIISSFNLTNIVSYVSQCPTQLLVPANTVKMAEFEYFCDIYVTQKIAGPRIYDKMYKVSHKDNPCND